MLMEGALFGPGAGETILSNFQCTGIESNVLFCPYVNSTLGQCNHSMDVGLQCSSEDGF